MMGFLDIIVVAAGAYLLYGWYLLVFRNEIKEGLLISKNTDAKKCKDIEGFKAYMGPRALALAISAVISGGMGLYQTYVRPIPTAVYWVFYVLFFAILIVFGMAARKAEKTFF